MLGSRESLADVLLLLVYVAYNLALMLYPLAPAWDPTRAGYIALANIPLLLLLSSRHGTCLLRFGIPYSVTINWHQSVQTGDISLGTCPCVKMDQPLDKR